MESIVLHQHEVKALQSASEAVPTLLEQTPKVCPVCENKPKEMILHIERCGIFDAGGVYKSPPTIQVKYWCNACLNVMDNKIQIITPCSNATEKVFGGAFPGREVVKDF